MHKAIEQNPYLVGRSQEIQFCLTEVAQATPTKIINIYGTTGVGKSSLLRELAHLFSKAGFFTVCLDGERIEATPQAFCQQVWKHLHPAHNSAVPNEAALYEQCLHHLTKTAQQQRVILCLDSYEQWEKIDQWLRDCFLKPLKQLVTVVIAGRNSLSEQWFLSPEWRQSIVRVPLVELSFEAVRQFAHTHGITHSEHVLQLWNVSKGHPLTFSLTAFSWLEQSDQNYRMNLIAVPYLIERWLKEIPDEVFRCLIEAASFLREFNQESLSFVANKKLSAAHFYQLIRFSFVKKTERGWTMHPRLRETILQELFMRVPKYFQQLRRRTIQYYTKRLVDNDSKEDICELMYLTGHGLIRSLIAWCETDYPRFKPAGASARKELEAYIVRRRQECQEIRIKLYDLLEHQHYTYTWSKEQTCESLQSLDLPKVLELGDDVVRVMRGRSGEITGLAVIIPINRKTLPYLQNRSRGKAYFTSLAPEEYARLAVPEHERSGWFIETVDVANIADWSQQTAIGRFLCSLVASGEFIVVTPPPLPFFTDLYHSLGFTVTKKGTKRNDDGITPTPTFAIHLDKDTLLQKIQKLFQQPDASPQKNMTPLEKTQPTKADLLTSRIRERSDITEREKEVAILLVEGLTNAEIAKRLYLSEATIKKHMKSMLQKLEATNRTQLLKKFLD